MKIEFNKGDLFFEPVLAFFASWTGYHLLFANERHDVVRGRLRGMIVSQIEFIDDPLPGKLRRKEDVEHLEFQLSESDPPLPSGERIPSGRLMEFWCQQMMGHAYEMALSDIEAKFGSKRNRRKDNWPSELQFFYHVRNGCVHGNSFNIWPDAISDTIQTVWRRRSITFQDNGHQVAGEFMGPADFIALLCDVQKTVVRP